VLQVFLGGQKSKHRQIGMSLLTSRKIIPPTQRQSQRVLQMKQKCFEHALHHWVVHHWGRIGSDFA